MADADVAADVQTFLREHIESYEQLEILLLLRAQPDRSWAPAAAASELGISEGLAEGALRFLCRERLLGVDAGGVVRFKYAPETPALVELVARLAAAYVDSRLAVMRLMTANAIERLRVGAVTRFADAFLLRRKRNQDG
ncbi:MAG: hypothetical protein ABI895_40620 [Deltaproteobacteria bacterium]